jgi:hypothetical protein
MHKSINPGLPMMVTDGRKRDFHALDINGHLRLQDFRFIGEYNHEVHKISSKLRFCGKEPSDAENIEKTLSTMLPSERLLQQQ